MKVFKTSDTTFELKSDNGCRAIAGFALVTMGRMGVYFLRPDSGMTKEQAYSLFAADAGVREVVALLPQGITG
jgi:hypothetical protein